MKAPLTCLFISAALCASACSGGKGNDASSPSSVGASPAPAAVESGANAVSASAELQDGKWPASVYSKYGIDEISTKGKVVYTDFQNGGSSRYRVYYHGVTQEEMKAWADKLVAKGMRISDSDKAKLKKKYDHDVSIYLPEEKQPFRMHLSFDFSRDMEIEYAADEHNPAFTITEKKEGDSANYYIYYNMVVSLNSLETETELTGSFAPLGLKPEDLKFSDNVRAVSLTGGDRGGSINILFYTDHFVTKEDFDAGRNVLIDKLAEKGAKFYDVFKNDKELSAAEMKASGVNTYLIENNGKKFALIVDPDASFDQFGGRYGARLMMKK